MEPAASGTPAGIVGRHVNFPKRTGTDEWRTKAESDENANKREDNSQKDFLGKVPETICLTLFKVKSSPTSCNLRMPSNQSGDKTSRDVTRISTFAHDNWPDDGTDLNNL